MSKDGTRKRREHPPLGSDNDDSSAASNNMFDEEKAYKAMAEFFCQAGLPPSAVKDKYFGELLHPHFDLNYDTFVRRCIEVEKANKIKIKNVLKNLDGKFALSMELMRTDPFGRGYVPYSSLDDEQLNVYDYLCVKAHFIDEDWKSKSLTMGYFSTMDGEEDSDPEKIITKLLTDWEIEDKVSTILSQIELFDLGESAAAIKDELQLKRSLSLPLDGRFFHVSCCADILSSIAEEAFSRIDSAIGAIRAYSWWKNAPLYWDSTLGMLQEAHESEAEGRYEEDDPPTAEEWDQIRRICKLVQKMYDAAEVLFETNFATGGVYFHNLQELRASLIEESKSPDGFTKKIADEMVKKLDKYWERDAHLLAIVTALDPRYKLKYFEFSTLKYGASSGISDIKTVSDDIHKLYDDYASCVIEKEYLITNESRDSDSDGEEGDCLRPEVRERRSNPAFGFKCLDEYRQFVRSQPPEKSELDYYLEMEPIVPWNKNFSVVSWWEDASDKYPTLSRMARDFLPIRFSLVNDANSEAYYTRVREPDQKLEFLEMAMKANKL